MTVLGVNVVVNPSWCVGFWRPEDGWACLYRWILWLGPLELRRWARWQRGGRPNPWRLAELAHLFVHLALRGHRRRGDDAPST